MLKTNSKKAAENLRQYIMDNFHPEDYTDNPPKTFPEIAKFILDTFERQKRYEHDHYKNKAEMFEDWTQGLLCVLDTSYYLNRAVEDLGSILEETEEEKARFTEDDACKLLTNLIYRQLVKEAKK